MNNAKDFIGKTVEVEMDRPLGTRHPKHGFCTVLIMDSYQVL